MTELDPDKVLEIQVADWTYDKHFAVKFTEREEIEKFINDWNSVVLGPISKDEKPEGIRYMV